MRPFIPPSIHASGTAEISEQLRALQRAEDAGRGKGRKEGEAEGYARGLEEGEAKARAALEPQIDQMQAELDHFRTQDALTAVLRNVLAARREDRAATDNAAAKAIEAALRLVFPALAQAAEGQEVIALLRATLAEREQDKLTVRANPTTLDRVRVALAEAPLAAEADRVILQPDPGQGTGAAQIAWQFGGLSYDPAKLLATITKALTSSGLSSDVGEKSPALVPSEDVSDE